MSDESRDRRALVAAGIFVAATAVTVAIAARLVTPPSITVAMGDATVRAGRVGPSLRPGDAIALTVAAFAAGASATVLLVDGEPVSPADRPVTEPDDPADSEQTAPSELLAARRSEWEEIADRLANNERLVYEAVLDADGVLPQSEIVERTDVSKATVSRALDNLEARDLIERKRRGMGNVVVLS
ncbi:helix-turn-helix transcriptional regulator [Halomicrobium mukohataei]|uniref:Regulatory protein GntR HTH n=2 Tax=Halomicrobium mukohataei TaxID=57705 RepID=C7P4U4_HALMD|nr:MarR family transcriptional regulator [Halomicrobium mukohataei]ACV49339.1 regulatory protein GntR HTH [Halomicrobium mukohataei DSM 12286]QCD67177.1 MarR family transcriptional regulator [Halomicrobium mukohataei]